MASLETLAAFALATLMFAYLPGPALLYTTAQTVSRGRRAGFFAAAGIHLGCYAHVIAAACGLSALFLAVPVLYAALKIGGGLYLVWIGIHMIRNRTSSGGVDILVLPPRSARRAFVDSVIVELTNPKVAMFFIAFLPQFVDPAGVLPVWAQFLILGVVVNCAFSSADICAVLFASGIRSWLGRSPCFGALVPRLGGAVLIGLGFRLATERT